MSRLSRRNRKRGISLQLAIPARMEAPVYIAGIKESVLPDYQLEGKKKLNQFEQIFQKNLSNLKRALPKNYQLQIKQRAPKKMFVNNRPVIQKAYVVKQRDNTTYVVIPKIKDLESLSDGLHELCHVMRGHHDPQLGQHHPRFNHFQKSKIIKELEVSKCIEDKLLKEGIVWSDRRSLEDIERIYK